MIMQTSTLHTHRHTQHTYFFNSNQISKSSNWQDEEACTSEGAAWRDLDQSQVKATHWSFYSCKGIACPHARGPSSKLQWAGLGLAVSQMACTPSNQQLAYCIWFEHRWLWLPSIQPKRRACS